jgi:hypothetical protein
MPHRHTCSSDIDLETEVEDDIGRSDLNDPRPRQFFPHVRGMFRRGLAGGDAAVETFVAPVQCRERNQALGSRGVSDDRRVDLDPAEDVIPVRVGVHDCERMRSALHSERAQKLVRMGPRRATVEHQRPATAHDGAHGWAVGPPRRHPVHVLSDPPQSCHASAMVTILGSQVEGRRSSPLCACKKKSPHMGLSSSGEDFGRISDRSVAVASRVEWPSKRHLDGRRTSRYRLRLGNVQRDAYAVPRALTNVAGVKIEEVVDYQVTFAEVGPITAPMSGG